jgi:hypothetical protein
LKNLSGKNRTTPQRIYRANRIANSVCLPSMINSKIGYAGTPSSPGFGGSGTYTYNDGVAPTTATLWAQDNRLLNYTAKAAGNKLVFHATWTCLGGSTTGAFAICVFRDSDVNAIAWEYVPSTAGILSGATQFGITVADALNHNYRLRLVYLSGATSSGFTGKMFRVEEYTQ